MASPLGQKRVMAIDPGFRTGCKVVCLDAQGTLLHNEAIFPHPPVSKTQEAAAQLASMIHKYKVEAIAIGNGTASRETKAFIERHVATDGITITDASNPSTSITATTAGTVTANFIQLQPTTVYLKPGDNWNQDNARFAIHYWHDGQPTGWVDMTEIDCNRDYFVGTIPAGYTEFMFVRMNPANPENKCFNFEKPPFSISSNSSLVCFTS